MGTFSHILAYTGVSAEFSAFRRDERKESHYAGGREEVGGLRMRSQRLLLFGPGISTPRMRSQLLLHSESSNTSTKPPTSSSTQPSSSNFSNPIPAHRHTTGLDGSLMFRESGRFIANALSTATTFRAWDVHAANPLSATTTSRAHQHEHKTSNLQLLTPSNLQLLHS